MLHTERGFGCGTIARYTGRAKSTILNILRRRGVYDPVFGKKRMVESGAATKGKRRVDVASRLIASQYRIEQLQCQRWDDCRHWNKHPIARLNYYYRSRTRRIQMQNDYQVRRAKTDIGFRIKKACRLRIWKTLKRCGQLKTQQTEQLIGCSITHLLNHIQIQFQPGMTWDNYGEWHIDHIKPCAAYDLSDPLHQRLCFHYTNLQPLWAADNLRKSDHLLMN